MAARLGVGVRTTSAPVGVPLDALVGLALRRNPRRAHLLVSTVLGKHVPADPRLVLGAGRLLGLLVADALRDDGEPTGGSAAVRDAGPALVRALAGEPGAAAALLATTTTTTTTTTGGGAVLADRPCTVLGYAETATGLSHAVADVLRAPHLHSTRRSVPGAVTVGGFQEEHSHATDHLLLPDDPALLSRRDVLVLVDDELSTGRTVLNTVAALQALAPRGRYVVAALVDLRSAPDRAATQAAARELGTRIDVVALATGVVDLPPDVLARGARLVTEHDDARRDATPPSPLAPVLDLGAAGWPAGTREGARHGATPQDAVALDAAVDAVARRLLRHLADRPAPHRVLVLGHEELLHAPQRLAAALADTLDARGAVVHSSSTTRSPVLAVDADGYAVRTALAFRAPEADAAGPAPGPPGQRYAYNVAPGATPGAASPHQRYDDVVVVVDDAVDPASLAAPDGLLPAVAGACGRVTLVTLPVRAPEPQRGQQTGGDGA